MKSLPITPLVFWLLMGVSGVHGVELTFFGWSDQHVKTDGSTQHLHPFIDAMNAMPGTLYPESVGSKVGRPAFVIGAGDVTEWPTNAAMRGYDEVLAKRLKFKAMDVLGNHDDGGLAFSPTMLNWCKRRHGSLSYVFQEGGVRFIALWSRFDPKGKPFQPITAEALGYLKTELAKAPEGQPIVLFTHLCYDAMTNRDELIKVIGDANVVLILGGHYHKATLHRYKGRNWVQLPSPKSDFNHFTVLRITDDRLLALPYDFVKKEWVSNPRQALDLRIGEAANK
jgi:3',5'-cyclic AMP phosphodiesterase CpdA